LKSILDWLSNMSISKPSVVTKPPSKTSVILNPTKPKEKLANSSIPWYDALHKMIGKHEVRDNKELRAWLKSDGATLGDPAVQPWCGDAVETAILVTLPNEILPKNPYLAAAWSSFGKLVKPQKGAILSFWRGSPSSWQGHVGIYAGEDSKNFYVLGGNQSNSISIVPIAKNRLRKNGSRWPLTGQEPQNIIVKMSGGIVSTNEA